VFAAADRTLSIPLRIGRVAGVPIEPRGIVVDPGRPGWDGLPDKITVWTSTQAPHAVRDAIAEVCRLPQHRIRVIGPDVGGGFGVKDHIYEDELMVVLAAIRLGRPVKWIEDRRESLTTTTQPATSGTSSRSRTTTTARCGASVWPPIVTAARTSRSSVLVRCSR